MKKTHLKTLAHRILILLLLLIKSNGTAQDTVSSNIDIIVFLQELEDKFNVKFSYADADLEEIKIVKPKNYNLQTAINYISEKSSLQIQKLNDRYYSVSKNSSITICATVLDNYEDNTIPGATVKILNTDKATVTDTEGAFYLENIPRKAIVQITHMGFKPYFTTAENLIGKSSSCKTIVLAQNYQELEEVVVYKFLTDGLVKLPDGGIEMNTDKFGILPGLTEPDILQTVQSLPGIKSVDETVSDINIRGGTNDQNLIIWDGIKMYQSGHFFGLISAFNPYLTDKITIIKNGTSALYGDGVSGVLDMRTKNTITNSVYGGAGLNLISGDAYGQVPIKDNLAIQFSGRRSLTDFLNTPTYNTFSEKAFQDSDVQSDNDFYFYDFSGKILYDIAPYQKLRISLIHIKNHLDYLETNLDDSNSKNSSLDQTNISFGATLHSDWTENFKTDLNLYYTRYRLNALSISDADSQRLLQSNLVLEKSAKLTSTYMFNENLRWTNGYQVNETGIQNQTDLNEPEFISNIKGVIYTHSLYSEGEYNSYDQRFMAKIGARLNYIENINTFKELVLEPRLNLSYEFAPHLKTEVLGEYKSQSTNQIIDLEQNFLGIEKRRWILADGTTLPVVKSKQGSIGFNYDENSFYVGIEGFYKLVTGINVETQGFQNQNQFNKEIGEYTIKGVEFLINKKNNDYSAWLSYAYNINDYTFDAITPTHFPNNLDIRHSLTIAGNYNYNNLKIGIGINYRSGKPYTRPDTNTPVNDTTFPYQINYQRPNSSRLPEYIRADASVTYDFKISARIKASTGISVLNFTNRKNVLNTYYRLNEANEVETVQRTSLGVTPNASFRIQF
ncbi:TonB-dependent receptor [Maribacter thermophilus]|uniref:TonB-dependent receptor n=1 Tax=Maribacter thermophilus TaxID=1197874 RepID=UPI0006411365|nr:carboxypeptidase-like regulatory domain-containing protein [Maribacter thermophilus]